MRQWREEGETWETPAAWERRNSRIYAQRLREARLFCVALGLLILLAGVVLAACMSRVQHAG